MQKVLYTNFEGVLDFSSTNEISSTKRAYFEQIQKYRAKPNRASDSLLARNARHTSSKSNARPALTYDIRYTIYCEIPFTSTHKYVSRYNLKIWVKIYHVRYMI